MKTEIKQLDDIRLLVDAFYAKVRQDDLLGRIFDRVIQDRWPQHLGKMYTFWQTVLLGEHTYYGNPFGPHAELPVERKHFERWLELFHQTLDEHFEGEKADEAKWRASKMAEMFQFKIAYFRDSGQKPLV
ncbi:group III truncated hemoglobin [Pseudozobellia thermophila]|uniref:Hemoglobin n=1 Tax=Pseudozobellia thermophila TaxID=192903 RepID=A0A1M6I7S8_9FLAO|nr:group III truncated hemoglobin [Pseudozobellia thermophila]SHJ30403.1 hemoglobin [Pseudozobellia thermophila]